MFRRLPLFILVALLTFSSVALSGCTTQSHDDVPVTIASMDHMPGQVQRAPHRVSQAYRFAADHSEILQHMPCYCGCGPMGHDSNYDCFWHTEGVFDNHALGCGICVDIAQDVMDGLQKGHSPTEIRAQVDKDYARFGPPTDTPLPVAQR